MMVDDTVVPDFPVRFIIRDEMLILRVENVVACGYGVWLELHHFTREEPPMPQMTRSLDDLDPDLEPPRKLKAAVIAVTVVLVLGFALGALTVLALT